MVDFPASHGSLPGGKNDSFKNYFFGVAKLPFYAKRKDGLWVSRPKKVLMHDRCIFWQLNFDKGPDWKSYDFFFQVLECAPIP